MDLLGLRIGVMLEDDLVSVKAEPDSDEDVEVEVEVESGDEVEGDVEIEVEVEVEVEVESEGGFCTESAPCSPDEMPIAKRLKRRR